MNEQPTQYLNTDFDLESDSSLQRLAGELRKTCDVLHCTENGDGSWQMTIEARHDECGVDRNPNLDIAAMLEAIADVSEGARTEYNSCSRRDFNIGYECWDSWAFNSGISHQVLQMVVRSGCSISWTLYPMRNPDGAPRENEIVE